MSKKTKAPLGDGNHSGYQIQWAESVVGKKTKAPLGDGNFIAMLIQLAAALYIRIATVGG